VNRSIARHLDDLASGDRPLEAALSLASAIGRSLPSERNHRTISAILSRIGHAREALERPDAQSPPDTVRACGVLHGLERALSASGDRLRSADRSRASDATVKSEPRAAILHALSYRPLGVLEIADATERDRSQVSRLLEELRQSDLVEEVPEGDLLGDKRRKPHRLTTNGARVVDELGFFAVGPNEKLAQMLTVRRLAPGVDYQTLDQARALMDTVAMAENTHRSKSIRELVGLGDRDTAIVVPLLEREPRESVAIEDVYAIGSIARVIARATPPAQSGARRPRTSLVTSPQLGEEANVSGNVFSVCSVRRNSLTRTLIGHPDLKLPFRFTPVARSDGHWGIYVDDHPYVSPSYDEEQHFLRKGLADKSEMIRHDYAVVARFPNPWSPDAKAWVVAGVRAFGTQGAAQFLDENAKELAAETKGQDFYMILWVEDDKGDLTAKSTAGVELLTRA
jgi:DNA-binding MarR family transcriptional regulator